MKKVLYLIGFVAAALLASPVSAQKQDIFNHLSAGVTVGLPGWGIDVAAPVCNYVQVRAGFTMMPHFKYSTDLDLGDVTSDQYSIGQISGQYPASVDVEGKLNFFNGKFLFDVYPFRRSNFHLTVGAYFGTQNVIDVYNKEDGALLSINRANENIDTYNASPAGMVNPVSRIGLELGDYLLTPDERGNVNAQIRTASFKPYVGFGFGRAVPKKRIGFMTEIGVMFWGSPKLYSNGHEITDENVSGDGGDFLKTMSKITVFPVINFRLCGKIF